MATAIDPATMKMLKNRMYSTTRNANKRLKRRDVTISSQCELIKMYERKLQGAENQISNLRLKLNRVNHRSSYGENRLIILSSRSPLRMLSFSIRLNCLSKISLRWIPTMQN